MNEMRKKKLVDKLTEKCKCSHCGKTIEVPRLYRAKLREILRPYCPTATMFVVQYLIHEGWHILNEGVGFQHPFFCPDCWDEGKPEYKKAEYCDDWYEQSKEIIKNESKENDKET